MVKEIKMELFQLRAGEDFIRLGQVLKAAGMAETGAEAKEVIQDGLVMRKRRDRDPEREKAAQRRCRLI